MLDLLSPVDNCSQKLSGSLICASIRRSYQDLYGEFGIAYLGTFGGMFELCFHFILIYLCRVKYAAIEADLYTALPKQN